jgi:hypothetical protein
MAYEVNKQGKLVEVPEAYEQYLLFEIAALKDQIHNHKTALYAWMLMGFCSGFILGWLACLLIV